MSTTFDPPAEAAAAAPVDWDRASRDNVPGQPDIWLFVLFETLVFAGYFGFYLYNRPRHPGAYLAAQQELHLPLGIVETLTLLTSSLLIARSVEAARSQQWNTALRNAYATASCGVLFLTLKVIEWISEARAGNTPISNEFFSYYYFLTGLHLLHLLIGFAFLGVLVHRLRGPAARSREVIETCGVYWHTVDYLWVLIFALLYVVR